MPAPPRIVSLWSAAEGGDFLGSASLLDQKYVLTVKHIFRDWKTSAVIRDQVYAGVGNGRPKATLFRLHDSVDAALLCLGSAIAEKVDPPWLMSYFRDLTGCDVWLHAVSPKNTGKVHRSQGPSIGSYVEDRNEWEVYPETARGFSGGLISVGHEVVGLLSSRVKDEPLARAISIHHLYAWICEQVPGWTRFNTAGSVDDIASLVAFADKHACLQLLSLHWSPKNLGPTNVSTILKELRKAIAKTRPVWLTKRQELFGHPEHTKNCCLRMVEMIISVGIDHEELKGWRFDQEPVPLESAVLAAVCRALASGERFRLSVDVKDGRDAVPERAATVSVALTAGLHEEKRQDVGKQFYAKLFPTPFASPIMTSSDFRHLKSRMEQLLDDDDEGHVPYQVLGLASLEIHIGELKRLADYFRAKAIARTGVLAEIECPSKLLYEPEEVVVQALCLCLEEINKIT